MHLNLYINNKAHTYLYAYLLISLGYFSEFPIIKRVIRKKTYLYLGDFKILSKTFNIH